MSTAVYDVVVVGAGISKCRKMTQMGKQESMATGEKLDLPDCEAMGGH